MSTEYFRRAERNLKKLYCFIVVVGMLFVKPLSIDLLLHLVTVSFRRRGTAFYRGACVLMLIITCTMEDVTCFLTSCCFLTASFFVFAFGDGCTSGSGAAMSRYC